MMTYVGGKFIGVSENMSYQQDVSDDIPEIEMGNILTSVPDLDDLLEETPNFDASQDTVLTLNDTIDDVSYPLADSAFETEIAKSETGTGLKEIFSNIISIFN